jgi:hypothetical protein
MRRVVSDRARGNREVLRSNRPGLASHPEERFIMNLAPIDVLIVLAYTGVILYIGAQERELTKWS